MALPIFRAVTCQSQAKRLVLQGFLQGGDAYGYWPLADWPSQTKKIHTSAKCCPSGRTRFAQIACDTHHRRISIPQIARFLNIGTLVATDCSIMKTPTPANTIAHLSDAVLLGFAKTNLNQLWAERMVADHLADRIEADVTPARVNKSVVAV